MTAFTGTHIDADTIAVFRENYKTPHYFAWERSGTAWTPRGLPVVYILAFDNGLVKVGQTVDFVTRLSANRSSRRVKGSRLQYGWRLGSDDMDADEAAVLGIATRLGGTPVDRTREWFTGIEDVHLLMAAAETWLIGESEPAHV